MWTRRVPAGLSVVFAALTLGGCASTNSNPASLIPENVQVSVMAEDRMLGVNPTGRQVSVDDMLTRARDDTTPQGQQPGGAQAQGQPGQPGQPPQGQPQQGQPQGGNPQMAMAAPAQTGSISPTRTPSEPKPLFEITFDGAEDMPSAAVNAALNQKIKSSRVAAKAEVTILVGPGPGTTAFEQALLANKRARNVRSLLPEGWKISQVYDPAFPPDTVSIVLGSRN